MRPIVFIFLLLAISCNSKKEMSLSELKDATWTELEPGIGYIRIDKSLDKKDSIQFNILGFDRDGNLMPIPAQGPGNSAWLEYLYPFLDSKQPPGNHGYLRVDHTALAIRTGPVLMIAYIDYYDSAVVEKDILWLRSLPEVENVEYISKEAAAKRFIEDNGSDFEKILTDNPLPASFDITLKREASTEAHAEQLKQQIESKITYLDDIQYPESMLKANSRPIVSYIEYRRN
jgi:hypothetical protein